MDQVSFLARTQATQGAQTTPQPRLVRAAHEFEAQMMKELLKPLSAQKGLFGEEEADSGSGGALTEYATEALGRAMSDHGGLGIANQIIGELSRSGNHQVTSPVTGKQNENTVLKSLQ